MTLKLIFSQTAPVDIWIVIFFRELMLAGTKEGTGWLGARTMLLKSQEVTPPKFLVSKLIQIGTTAHPLLARTLAFSCCIG